MKAALVLPNKITKQKWKRPDIGSGALRFQGSTVGAADGLSGQTYEG